MDFDNSLIEEFVAESNEHLQHIEDDLLNLEKTMDSPDPNLVDRIFRAIHSVKGAAGFLGFVKVNQLSHSMETLLSLVRGGEKVPGPEVVDVLLTGSDLLSGMVNNVHHSEETDIADILSQLSIVIGEDAAEVQETGESRKESSPGKIWKFNLDLNSLNELPPEQEHLYKLEYDLFDLQQNTGMSPMDLVRELKSTGTIADSILEHNVAGLSPEDLDAPVTLVLLYSSLLEPAIMAKASHLSEDRMSHMTREEAQAALKASEKKAGSAKKAEKASAMEKQAKAADTPKPSKGKEEAKAGTIRIPVPLLDDLMTLAGELVLVRNQQLLATELTEPITRTMVQRLDVVTSELQESIMRTRMQPIGNVFNKMPRIVRDLSNKLGKQIQIEIAGSEVELDKTILELLADPLTHLTRNCCDHGIETPEVRTAAGKPATGHVSLSAFHEGGQINIVLSDDGRGIDVNAVRNKALEKGVKTETELEQMTDKDVMNLIMMAGFSTAKQVSDVSGRGVGMDVVKTSLEKIGGTIELDSKQGNGTDIHLRLPLTLAIIPCLIVKVGGNKFAVPQFNLEELVCLYDDDVHRRIESVGNQEVCRLRDTLLPMVRLNETLARPEPFTEETRAEIVEKYRSIQEERLAKLVPMRKENKSANIPQSLNFAVVRVGMNRFCLIVDEVIGTEEIVVKPMHPAVKKLSIYSGSTIMGDGRVALILDIEGVAKHAGISLDTKAEEGADIHGPTTDHETQTVLLFTSGEKERFAVALPLIRRIERITLDKIEKVGQREFVTVDGVSTLVLRLDQALNVSPCVEREEMFLLLPKYINRPFGILMSRLIDIDQASVSLNTESYMEDGILGTDIIREHMTLFVDIYRLIELAEPDWFDDRKKNNPTHAKGKKVLVVEDGAFFRQLVKNYLESEGFEVTTADNGASGLESLEHGQFDLIVSDLEMPIMNGFEFMKKVRSDSRFSDMPTIALTSLSEDKDRDRAMECGFDIYAIKIDREKLLTTVSGILKN